MLTIHKHKVSFELYMLPLPKANRWEREVFSPKINSKLNGSGSTPWGLDNVPTLMGFHGNLPSQIYRSSPSRKWSCDLFIGTQRELLGQLRTRPRVGFHRYISLNDNLFWFEINPPEMRNLRCRGHQLNTDFGGAFMNWYGAIDNA